MTITIDIDAIRKKLNEARRANANAIDQRCVQMTINHGEFEFSESHMEACIEAAKELNSVGAYLRLVKFTEYLQRFLNADKEIFFCEKLEEEGLLDEFGFSNMLDQEETPLEDIKLAFYIKAAKLGSTFALNILENAYLKNKSEKEESTSSTPQIFTMLTTKWLLTDEGDTIFQKEKQCTEEIENALTSWNDRLTKEEMDPDEEQLDTTTEERAAYIEDMHIFIRRCELIAEWAEEAFLYIIISSTLGKRWAEKVLPKIMSEMGKEHKQQEVPQRRFSI